MKNYRKTPAHAVIPIGTLIADRYKIVTECGSGSFGTVFHGLDTYNASQPVALKVYLKGKRGTADANEEQQMLLLLRAADPKGTEGLVHLLNRLTWKGHDVLVMPLKGKTLFDHICAREPGGGESAEAASLTTTTSSTASRLFTTEEVLRCAVDMAESLAFLHDKVRVVHSDLKPENILAESCATFSGSPGERVWCLGDLGCAVSLKNAESITGTAGTLNYRAPEMLLKKNWDYAVDMWALGCVLYEMHTGNLLFAPAAGSGSESSPSCVEEHLAQMRKKLGPLPPSMQRPQPQKRGRNNNNTNDDGDDGLVGVTDTAELLTTELKDDPAFLALLLPMLEYDPAKRIRSADFARRARKQLERSQSIRALASSDARRSHSPTTPRTYAARAGDDHSRHQTVDRKISEVLALLDENDPLRLALSSLRQVQNLRAATASHHNDALRLLKSLKQHVECPPSVPSEEGPCCVLDHISRFAAAKADWERLMNLLQDVALKDREAQRELVKSLTTAEESLKALVSLSAGLGESIVTAEAAAKTSQDALIRAQDSLLDQLSLCVEAKLRGLQTTAEAVSRTALKQERQKLADELQTAFDEANVLLQKCRRQHLLDDRAKEWTRRYEELSRNVLRPTLAALAKEPSSERDGFFSGIRSAVSRFLGFRSQDHATARQDDNDSETSRKRQRRESSQK